MVITCVLVGGKASESHTTVEANCMSWLYVSKLFMNSFSSVPKIEHKDKEKLIFKFKPLVLNQDKLSKILHLFHNMLKSTQILVP